MEIISDIVLFTFLAAFLSGFLITAVSGSGKAVKIWLLLVFLVFTGFTVYGFILSGGLLVFLVFQLVVLLIILFFVIIAGAAAGGGVYALIHNKSGSKQLSENEINDFLAVSDFAGLENITQDRALARIKSGFYTGGKYQGKWYVHKSELS
jgi:hypothetical protein